MDDEREAQVGLAAMVQAAGFELTDPGVAAFVRRLQNYCQGTLINLARSGDLFPKCFQLGMRSLPAPPSSWLQDSESVFAETSVVATNRFVADKIKLWVPVKASLFTFFINTSLFTFETIYRTYCKQVNDDHLEYMDDDNVTKLFDARRGSSAVEDRAVDRTIVLRVLRLMGDERLASIVAGLAGGKSKAEVARELSISEPTIHRAVAKFREALLEYGFSVEGSE